MRILVPALAVLLLLAGCAGAGTPAPAATSAGTASIEGTWHLAGHPEVALRLDDGTWTAHGTCATRTAAGGGSGTYRTTAGGGLRVVRTKGVLTGCPVGQDPPPDGARAITAFSTARSFAVHGDELTLTGADGAALGTLVR